MNKYYRWSDENLELVELGKVREWLRGLGYTVNPRDYIIHPNGDKTGRMYILKDEFFNQNPNVPPTLPEGYEIPKKVKTKKAKIEAEPQENKKNEKVVVVKFDNRPESKELSEEEFQEVLKAMADDLLPTDKVADEIGVEPIEVATEPTEEVTEPIEEVTEEVVENIQ